jgi:hypothetical protein
MIVETGRPEAPKFAVEEVNDPVRVEAARLQFERGARNEEWLQTHWRDVLPQAYGKFLAVAGQEAFIAETPEEAWAWAARAHPEDNGVLVRYVRSERGPRIYFHRG